MSLPIFKGLRERSLQLVVLSPIYINQGNLYDQNMLFFKKVIDTSTRLGGANIDYFPNVPLISLSVIEKAFIALGILSMLFLLILRVHRINTNKQIGSILAIGSIIFLTVLMFVLL